RSSRWIVNAVKPSVSEGFQAAQLEILRWSSFSRRAQRGTRADFSRAPACRPSWCRSTAAPRSRRMHLRNGATACLVRQPFSAGLNAVVKDLGDRADLGGDVLQEATVAAMDRPQRLHPRTQPCCIASAREERKQLISIVEMQQDRTGAEPVLRRYRREAV